MSVSSPPRRTRRHGIGTVTGGWKAKELTMTVLRSYVGGAWTEPADEGRPVLDAVTGEEVARVSSAGIDMAAALDYGRSSGGPALRELTFHQRAALLKSLGQVLREHRQELYTLSARTGATLGDSKFDIDGGIGVLLSYASRAKRELPNDTILAEGAVEPLGRAGTFVRQHILGPEAGPGTAEFDLYVRQLVTEMTVKAGQKCTAIRRALVPAALADQVAEAARDRLAAVVVGNPAEEGVQMGALAGLEQREEVRRSVKALLSAGRIVSGDPDHVNVVGASAERGAFMAPLLLQTDDAGRIEPHPVEAFGPVSTIIGYQDTDQVIDLAGRGRGSLAGSVVTAGA